MNTITLKLDYRLICLGLTVIIIGMLAVWQPWQNPLNPRTITVTGQGSLDVTPDQFTFTPTYQKTNPDQKVAQTQVTEIGNDVVAQVKKLGVKDKQITTNLSVNQDYSVQPMAPDIKEIAPSTSTPSGYLATYAITIKVSDSAISTKILDYLATTPVLYQVTPQSGLSKDKQQQVALDARKKALANAKEQAAVSAHEVNARVGKVLKISDLNQYGGAIPIMASDTTSSREDSAKSPILLTGQQEVQFSLTVEYQLK